MAAPDHDPALLPNTETGWDIVPADEALELAAEFAERNGQGAVKLAQLVLGVARRVGNPARIAAIENAITLLKRNDDLALATLILDDRYAASRRT